MSDFNDFAERIAYLEAKVEALQEVLAKRSRRLRILQAHLDPDSLLLASRILDGLPPLPRQANDLQLWHETFEMHAADVQETMHDLWRSTTPVEEPEPSS